MCYRDVLGMFYCLLCSHSCGCVHTHVVVCCSSFVLKFAIAHIESIRSVVLGMTPPTGGSVAAVGSSPMGGGWIDELHQMSLQLRLVRSSVDMSQADLERMGTVHPMQLRILRDMPDRLEAIAAHLEEVVFQIAVAQGQIEVVS